MTAPRAPLIAGACLAALALFVASAWRLESGFAPFLGGSGDPLLSAVSQELARGELARQLVLRVGDSSPEAASAAARALASALASHVEVESVRTGPNPKWRDAFLTLIGERAYLHLSDQPERELRARLSPAGLRAAAVRLRAELAGPSGVGLAERAPRDPLLGTLDAIGRLASLEGDVRTIDGQFASADGRFRVLLATTRHSPFSTSDQRPLQEFIAERFAALDAEAGGALELEQASLHRFAVASARIAERDAVVLGIVSSLAAIAVFLLLFGSLQLLLLSVLPLLAAVLTGCAATLLASGGIHVLTLAFGSTLLGVCVDYPIHFLSHHALAGGATAVASLRRLAPALMLGAATTLVGFAALLLANFAGVREMGAFASAGVMGGLLATFALTAPLTPAELPAREARRWLSERLPRIVASLERRPRAGVTVLLVAALFGATGLRRADWNDDMFSLNVPLDPAMLEENLRARADVAALDVARVALASGRDDEEALVRNDALAVCLADAERSGEIAGYRSLHALVWSEQLQRRNHALLSSQPRLAEDLGAALAEAGFRSASFQPFLNALREPPHTLSMEEVLGSPLAEPVRAFRVEIPDGVVLLTHLESPADLAAVEARCGRLAGVRFVDQRELVSGAYRSYRARIAPLLLGGFAGILAIGGLRYRSLRLALAAALPAGIAAAAALGALGWCGVALNLVHLLGALLVLGCGVDYGIFVVESRHDPQAHAATLLSVFAACLTTVTSFGLLGVSSFPVLRALGLTTALGVSFSLVLAVAAVAALRVGRRA